MPRLVKVPLEDAHIVNGNEFPVAFSLVTANYLRYDEIEQFLEDQASAGFFNKQVATHGAVVIRNIQTTDPEILSRYVKAIGIGSGDLPFEQNGSTAKRTVLTDVLTTANEGPPDLTIHQHNEFSRFKQYPTKLFFICTQYDSTTTGGATPIVHGAEFFSHLQRKVPQLLTELGTRGLYMAQTWTNTSTTSTSWRDYFCFGRDISSGMDLKTARKNAGERVVQTVSDHYEWLDNGNLLVHQHTKPIRNYRNKYTGKHSPVFFNSLATYYHQYKEKVGNTPTTKLLYDDGEPIPEPWLDVVLQSSIDLAYNHAWKEGDLAIVDNYQVSHGRLPWSGGGRKVIVSMWDTPNKLEFTSWSAQALAR